MIDAVFDGNSIFARSWFACAASGHVIPDLALKISVISTVTVFKNLGEDVDRTLFAWDDKAKKDKQRGPKPPAYDKTMEYFSECVRILFGTVNVKMPGYEADDVVATAAHHSDADRVYVVSGDKDLHQLQCGRIAYYCLNTKGVLSRQAIISKWGIKRPSHVAIALAIKGDPVDQVPGIHGWGPKKIAKLFEKITPEMPFEDVLAQIEAQIPDDLLPIFYESLNLTLLNRMVPGVPMPRPIRLAKIKHIRTLAMPGLEGVFTKTFGLESEVENKRMFQ